MFPGGHLPSAFSAHTLHKHTHTVPGNAADTGSPTISVPDSHLPDRKHLQSFFTQFSFSDWITIRILSFLEELFTYITIVLQKCYTIFSNFSSKYSAADSYFAFNCFRYHFYCQIMPFYSSATALLPSLYVPRSCLKSEA